jgi:hypothetical protein
MTGTNRRSQVNGYSSVLQGEFSENENQEVLQNYFTGFFLNYTNTLFRHGLRLKC